MRGKKNKFLSVVAVVAVVIVIFLAIGGLARCNSVKDKVNEIISPSFSVEFDGKKYKGDENYICLPNKGKAIFNVRNGGDYRVEVLPNVTDETDFNYTVGDKVYPYSGENLTTAFIDNKQIFSDKFFIDCSQNMSLRSVLSRIWGGAEITVTAPIGVCFYKLVVTSSNGETVTLLFRAVPTVVLSETSIYI